MADDTGDLLVRSGLVSSGALDEARRLVAAVGGTLGEQLVDNDAIRDDDLTEFYAQSLQVPRIRASALARISAGVIESIPPDMAIALRAIPILRSRDNRLTVALGDPSDDTAVEQIASVTKRQVVRAVATQMQIAWCLAHYYDHVTPLGKRLVQGTSQPKSHRQATTPAIATRARAKTASGETGTPPQVVEVLPTAADDDTAKIVARRRKRAAAPQPPELETRAGEVDLKAGPEPQVTSGPTIVVELGAEAGAVEIEAAVITPKIPFRPQISEYADEEPTAPMWFERKAAEDRSAPTKPELPPLLDPSHDDAPTPPARAPRTTRVGVPPAPESPGAAPRPTERWSDETPRRPASAPAPEVAEGPTQGASPTDLDVDPTEPGWGQPGTTIPPLFRGESTPAEDDESDAIPIPRLDTPPLVLAATSMVERSRPHTRSESGIARALEDTTQRVLTLIHHLEAATDRDSVVAAMVSHLADAHRRAGLFVARSNELSLFSIEPRPNAISAATFRLDRPSTLRDVVESRLPYRGPMNDVDSREYLQTVLGACPPEILLVPIAVRDRVVGVLFGEHRMRHTFDDQLALAARAAGMALERILKAKRG